jgi:hypothetical protein
MSTVKFDTWQNTDGTENYKCRAWVNFNGSGTVAIRASGNVSSITDHSVGEYTVNFTSALIDTNYTVVGTAGQGSTNLMCVSVPIVTYAPTTSAVRINVTFQNTSLFDSTYTAVAIFR